MFGQNLKREIDQIAKDKGIDGAEITGALEEAMLQAARKRFGQEKEIEARYNDEIGEVELFEFREVVENISDRDSQILIGEAQRDYDPDVELGDEIGVKLDTTDFGRILAQAAKQVIIQRIRDAERDNTFDEYRDRKGEVVNGIVRRFEKGSIIVDLGRAEGIIPAIETAHGLAGVIRLGKELGPDSVIILNLSGRGDKDVATAARWFGIELEHSEFGASIELSEGR